MVTLGTRWAFRGQCGYAPLVLLCLLLGHGLCPAAPTPTPLTGKKWLDMDYGPFLTFSIEAPEPGTNLAFKGIAINLGKAAGSDRNEAMVFDTDLLRYSAGWSGNFLALKSVVFDGEHWAYPHLDGEQWFGNPQIPGWAKAGSFKDPREFIYGPLPHDWAHWKGLYLHGDQVIFSYTVGDAPVLEMPGLERGPLTPGGGEGVAAFARNINLGKSTHDLILQIAYEEKRSGTMVSLQNLQTANAGQSAAQTLAVLSPPVITATPKRTFNFTNGLVGHWDFKDVSENVARDLSPARRELQLRKVRLAGGRAGGQALEFRGDGRGDLGVVPELEFFQTDLTFSAWVKTQGDGSIITQTAADGPWVPDGKSLFIRDGRLCFDIGWVGAVTSSKTVPVSQWTHVAMTWSHQDGKVTLFLNGLADKAGVVKPKRPQPTQVVRIGFTAPNFPATPYFKGLMDDLRLYQRALDAAEIQHLAGGVARREAWTVAAGVVGAPTSANWLATSDGHLRLQIPAAATPVNFKVLLTRVATTNLSGFAQWVQRSPAPTALAPFTRGGPARWAQTLVTQGKIGQGIGPYQTDVLTWPENNPWHSWMRFAGFDFFSDPTKAAICTWSGDVWLVAGLDASLEKITWRRFATGLYEPGGLKIVNDQIYVLARDQITRLHDLNGDGEADWYENFNNDTMNTEHFHEFVYDLQADQNGDFYYLKGACHARDAKHPQHGTFLKVSKDGSRTEILAKGFRAPNGLGLGPNGEFFTTDQEGYWMPQNRLNLIQPGRFYGNVWSWFPEGKPKTNDPPMVWVHREVDRSPSTMVWVSSEQWGPFKDKVLSLSYGVGKIFLVMMETIGGREQGGITELPMEFDTGIMRARFGPRDGQLYTCGLFGWAGNKTRDGGFYRVRYTGKPVYAPEELHVASDGVVLKFTVPLETASATATDNYSVQVFNYKWTENYGSPDFKLNGERGRDTLPVKTASLSRDHRTLFLELPGIQPVMQMYVQMNIKAADGTTLQRYVLNTIHRLGERRGLDWLGEQPVLAQKVSVITLNRETPGLAQHFVANGVADVRPARLAALYVPAGAAPTPFIAPGPFRCRWEGFVKLDLSDTYTFSATGHGKVSLKISGRELIRDANLTESGVSSAPMALRGGLNKLEIEYQSPARGEAKFRLLWTAPNIPWEPVPPGALVYDADDKALMDSQVLRDTRFMVGAMYCARCHQPKSPWPAAAMPELQLEGPSLDDCGNQFNIQWMVPWLKTPFGVVNEAIMPKCLQGDAEQMDREARDVVAFLATLKTNKAAAAFDAAALAEPSRIKTGEERFAKLGCVACHLFPNDKRLPDDTRRSLGHIRSKWQPGALVDFLQQPEKNWRWIRMPNFQLTRDEAQALAAYILSRCTERFTRDPMGPPKTPPPATLAELAADAANGAKLAAARGCANCHQIPGVTKRADYAPLEQVLRPQAVGGCLATDRTTRKTAPDFNLIPAQTEILAGALRRLPFASLRQDAWTEFAERQFEVLRCATCHERENAKDFWFQLEAQAKPKAAKPPADEEEAGLQEKTIHAQRPPLTWTGEKLRPEWMEQFLAGKIAYKPRRKLEARMPAFPAYAKGMTVGLAEAHGFEPTSPTPTPANPALAKVGQALVQKGALSCVDCHDTGKNPALAGGDTATINFAFIPERLRKTYYERYLRDPQRLLPGTMMPKFITDDGTTGVQAHFQGDARQQFEAIWHYMRSLEPEIGR